MQCGCDAASTFIWQSSLCCNQFRIEQASNIGQDTKDQSRSFEDIEMLQWRMRKIGSVLALLSPWKPPGPRYLQRSWCLLEFWEAIRTDEVQLHVVLPDQQQSSMLAAVEAGSLQTLWAALECLSLERASAKVEGDRDRINAYIARECGCESSTPQTIARVKHAIIRRLRIWLYEELTRHLELQALTGELVSPIFCAEVTRILEESSETEQAQSLINAVVRSLELWSIQSAESAESYCKGTLLKTKGILHYVQNQYAHCLTCFEKAKDAYEMSEQTSTDDYASVLKYLGLCCTRHSRHEDALGFFALSKSAHEAAETIETPGYATMLKNTGDCHDKMGNSEESMKFYLEAERIFESSGKTLEYARLLKTLGEMLQDSCHYSLASDRFLLAKDVYESIGVSSNSGYASVLKYLAVWLREQDEFDVAMELLVAATWVHEDIGQTKTLPYAALQKSIGVCHRDAGEYDQATAAFERAKMLYDELSGGRVPGERAALFKSMAACMREQGKVAEAMAMYEEAKSTLELDGETMTRGYAWILNLKGSLLSDQAQYDHAISLFEAAESILETLMLKGRKDHSIVLKNKGVCYCEQGRHTEALAVFEEVKHAYEYAGAVTSTDYAVLLKEMSKCSFQRGHPEEALQILSAAERVCNSEELSCGWRVHCRLQRCIAECYMDQRKKREAKAILIQARDAVNELRTAGKAQDDKLLSDIVDLISKLDRHVL
jgi:tetratricopeptide (TPR) repeat protein